MQWQIARHYQRLGRVHLPMLALESYLRSLANEVGSATETHNPGSVCERLDRFPRCGVLFPVEMLESIEPVVQRVRRTYTRCVSAFETADTPESRWQQSQR